MDDADRFAHHTVDQLVDAFNGEVGKDGWVRARGIYLAALQRALLATGLDCSSFTDGESMSMGRKIERVGEALQFVGGAATGGSPTNMVWT